MIDVIQQKLRSYNPETPEDEENALKEISQEIVLYALAEAGFFEHAAFLGGTCLRINHGLDRFSEDLDFSLRGSKADFNIGNYLDEVARVMDVYGYNIEMNDQSSASESVKSRFLKDSSIKRLLNFEHKQDLRKKVQIKLEVDINPPEGAACVPDYLSFPTQFMIMTHDLPSLLAGKTHALLCRSYTKGRDWYDFLWYVAQGVNVNLSMLENALKQMGPWKGEDITLDKEWLNDALTKKVQNISWDETKKDVERFLRPEKKKTLSLWSEDFFIAMVKKFIKNLE